MDLLAGGGEWHVLLRGAAHVDLVDLSQELLGVWRMCGRGVISHTVQPAMPEQETGKKKWHGFIMQAYILTIKVPTNQIMFQRCISTFFQK